MITMITMTPKLINMGYSSRICRSHYGEPGWRARVVRLEGVLDLGPGLLEVALGLVARPSASRRGLSVACPAVFLTPPLTASALCAIFLAILIGAAFHGLIPEAPVR